MELSWECGVQEKIAANQWVQNFRTMNQTQLTRRLTRIRPHGSSGPKNIYENTWVVAFSGALCYFKTPSLKEVEKYKWLSEVG